MTTAHSIALHPTPRWTAVWLEQFYAVGIAIRREYIALVLGICLIDSIFAWTLAFTFHQYMFRPTTVLLLLAAVQLPFSVWKSEKPSSRGYHAAMPVPYPAHTLIKTAIGWLWLMIVVVTCLSIELGFIGIVRTVMDLKPVPGGEVQWVHLVRAPTLAYLLVSIPVIASDHPRRWLGATFLAYMLAMAIALATSMTKVALFLNQIWSGTYGLSAALFGRTTTFVNINGRALSCAAPDSCVSEFTIQAMAIWLLIGVTGVILATFLRRQR